jgi:hypothetical protein
MWSRATIALISIFWIVMTLALWHSEFGGGRPVGSTVPPGMVWEKVLMAPDSSSLEIRHGTNRAGYCKWRPNVGQEFATGTRMDDNEEFLEGMVHELSYYTLDIDGGVELPDIKHRARFVSAIKLDTNRVWQEFSLKVTMRPDVYEIQASAVAQTVRIHVDAGGDKFERTIQWREFQNPQKLLAELGGPALPLMIGAMGIPMPAVSTNMAQALPLRWEANNDTLQLGHSKVRAYRLKGTLLDRYAVTFFISPVGEILRVELPNKIALVNNAIAGLPPAAND